MEPPTRSRILAQHEGLIIEALLVLTFVTGLVDAASFLGPAHVFTANLTGNIVLLGFAISGAHGLPIRGPLLSLGTFLAGAVTGGRFGFLMHNSSKRRWLVIAVLSESVLLVMAAFTAAEGRLFVAIACTAFAMGFRNATVRALAVPDLTTTVLTITLTGLAADSWLAGGSSPRLGRRTGSVLLMLAGAAGGALLLEWGMMAPLLAAALLAGVAAGILSRLPKQ